MARVLSKLALLALPLCSSIAQDAASQPAPRFPAEQPVPLSARVALLEQRMHGLEQRLKAFEKVNLGTKSDGSFSLSLNGARVVIAKDGTATVMPGPPATPAKAALPPEDCDPPYSVDENGRRSIKPECLQVGPCDPPYAVDPQGRRTVKKECL